MFKIVLLLVVFAALLIMLTLRKVRHQFARGLRSTIDRKGRFFASRYSPEEAAAFIASIPDYADRQVEQTERCFGDRLTYKKADLAVLERIIEKGWGKSPPKKPDPLVISFGSFFGETIRRLQGGTWDYSEDRGFFLREVGGVATVYPFEKIQKRFKDGEKESLALFYSALAKKIQSVR